MDAAIKYCDTITVGCIDRPLDALRPVVEFGEANFDYPFTSLAYTFTDSGTYAHKRRIGHGGDKT